MVTGTVITIIGIALLPVAALDAVGGGANPDPSSSKNLAYAMGTLAIIVIIQRVFKGFMATVAVLAGLVIGTGVAFFLGDASFDSVSTSPWFEVTTPFFFGIPKFSAAAIISMIVVMLITAVETTGDVFATGEIVDKRVGADDVSRALRADGLSTFIGGVLNSFPYTCFAENVGLVRLTRVKSRYVVAAAGCVHDPHRADPEGRGAGGQCAAAGAGRCGPGHVRDRRGGRHPDPGQGGFPRPPQRGHRRHQPGSGDVRHRATRCGAGCSGLGADHLRQRHHAGQPVRHPAEPGLPPHRQGLRTGGGRPARAPVPSGSTRSTR